MIAVFKAFSIIEGDLVPEPLPTRSPLRMGDLAALLTAMHTGTGGGVLAWNLKLDVGKGPGRRLMTIPLKPIATDSEYERSFVEPLSFFALGVIESMDGRTLWLYRDGVYLTERVPKSSEMDEVVLRIKALHFQYDKAMRRLSEQVANFEAVESQLRVGRGRGREPIPEDVKLLVWARDGGVCVKCGSAKELQFDHIIPLARGGSNDAANLQLLCRTCNQAKGERLV